MQTNAQYLSKLTVVQLKALAKAMGLKGYSHERKDMLVLMITMQLNILHGEAIEMDAVMEEAYGPKCEERSITIPEYLACERKHIERGEIRVSGFWISERFMRTMVVVFDNGLKQAVTPGEACYFTGDVMDMPSKGTDEVCATCGETYFIEGNDNSEELLARHNLDYTPSIVIDTAEFPMDHSQFISWYRRIGGDFEATKAIEADHAEALEMDSARKESASHNFDSVDALRVMIRALTPFADMALKASEATAEGSVRDLHYQTYLDMNRAADEMRRTLAFFDLDDEHTCSFQYEVGMSGCSYGCKIYRCEGCGQDREMHNATYGCRTLVTTDY